tara:strand:- start:990 stop:1274 length:285 start_codon:yes stop_codon:yes gene_type:complete
MWSTGEDAVVENDEDGYERWKPDGNSGRPVALLFGRSIHLPHAAHVYAGLQTAHCGFGYEGCPEDPQPAIHDFGSLSLITYNQGLISAEEEDKL